MAPFHMALGMASSRSLTAPHAAGTVSLARNADTAGAEVGPPISMSRDGLDRGYRPSLLTTSSVVDAAVSTTVWTVPSTVGLTDDVAPPVVWSTTPVTVCTVSPTALVTVSTAPPTVAATGPGEGSGEGSGVGSPDGSVVGPPPDAGSDVDPFPALPATGSAPVDASSGRSMVGDPP